MKLIKESLNEGFSTEEGRKLNSIARMLKYDDFEEMIGDNPGLYEICVQWIDEQFEGVIARERLNDPDDLERLGLYNTAERVREEWNDED